MAAVFLQVTPDVAKEWDIKEGGPNQKQEGTGEDKDSKKCGEREGSGDKCIASEVLGEVVPITLAELLGLEDCVQGQGVDRLTRPIGQKNALPALEGEENEEGNAVSTFR